MNIIDEALGYRTPAEACGIKVKGNDTWKTCSECYLRKESSVLVVIECK